MARDNNAHRKKRYMVFCIISILVISTLVSGLLIKEYISSAKNYISALAPVAENNQACKVITKQEDDSALNLNWEQKFSEQKTSSNEHTEPKSEFVEVNKNSINILFLGIDRTEKRDRTLGTYRTDTIALANIDLETKKVKVLSIPRDTYAFVPVENKNDKINHAYAFGSITGNGPESAIEAINKFIKYDKVDCYFALDMEPVPKIVDDLGGVELDVEIDMKTHGANLSKGKQLLDGKKAFDYIHWRYSVDGDICRIKRQQKFLKAMYQKLKDDNKLTKAISIVLNYNKNIKTNLNLKQMLALCALANDIPNGSTDYYMVTGEAKYMNNLWYWVPDEVKTEKLLKLFFK
ncbi:MAG: LCP family protein [Clostridia bacterium]|nr:LCP family protein [Clostridia bacterium]